MHRARSDSAKERRRQAILEAALTEFYENGFAAARTDAIAERAGLSKGTLYLYFDSKETLFRALIDDHAKPKLDQIESAMTQLPSFSEAIDFFVAFAPAMIRETAMPRLMKVLVGDSQTFPSIVDDYRQHTIQRGLDALATMLARAQERGEIDVHNTALTARLVVAPVVLSALWQAVFSGSDDADVDLETLFRLHGEYLRKALSPTRTP